MRSLFYRSIDQTSKAITQGHVHKVSEKKCNSRATILQVNLFMSLFINVNIKPMTPPLSTPIQNAIKFFSGVFRTLFKARYTINNNPSKTMLTDNNQRLIQFSK